MAVPHYQNLCSHVSHTWGNCRRGTDKPPLGKTTLIIVVLLCQVSTEDIFSHIFYTHSTTGSIRLFSDDYTYKKNHIDDCIKYHYTEFQVYHIQSF